MTATNGVLCCHIADHVARRFAVLRIDRLVHRRVVCDRCALLVNGATAIVRNARQHPQKHPWIMRLLVKKPAKLVAVAVANKMARIAWAIMAKGGRYRAPELAAAA